MKKLCILIAFLVVPTFVYAGSSSIFRVLSGAGEGGARAYQRDNDRDEILREIRRIEEKRIREQRRRDIFEDNRRQQERIDKMWEDSRRDRLLKNKK